MVLTKALSSEKDFAFYIAYDNIEEPEAILEIGDPNKGIKKFFQEILKLCCWRNLPLVFLKNIPGTKQRYFHFHLSC